MVTCNVCRKNKDIDDMKYPFHYLCKKCWDKLVITIGDEEIDKEMIY